MSDMYPDLEGRVAVVTGGSHGIGRGVVHHLRGAGMRVASWDVARPDDDPDLAAADLDVDCDVSDEEAVAVAVAVVEKELGAATVLVNNAGVTRGFAPAEMTAAEWDLMLGLNLKAAWLCARATLPAMSAAGAGAIVNVASIHATLTTRGLFPYAATKSGLVGLTRSMALDLAAEGIRVNAVCPGLIDTPAVRGRLDSEEAVAAAIAEQPLGRMGDPLDVAELVTFLASERSRFITGAAIPIDGGVGARLSTI